MDGTQLKIKESIAKADYVKVGFLWPMMSSSKTWVFTLIQTSMTIQSLVCTSLRINMNMLYMFVFV